MEEPPKLDYTSEPGPAPHWWEGGFADWAFSIIGGFILLIVVCLLVWWVQLVFRWKLR